MNFSPTVRVDDDVTGIYTPSYDETKREAGCSAMSYFLNYSYGLVLQSVITPTSRSHFRNGSDILLMRKNLVSM